MTLYVCTFLVAERGVCPNRWWHPSGGVAIPTKEVCCARHAVVLVVDGFRYPWRCYLGCDLPSIQTRTSCAAHMLITRVRGPWQRSKVTRSRAPSLTRRARPHYRKRFGICGLHCISNRAGHWWCDRTQTRHQCSYVNLLDRSCQFPQSTRAVQTCPRRFTWRVNLFHCGYICSGPL